MTADTRGGQLLLLDRAVREWKSRGQNPVYHLTMWLEFCEEYAHVDGGVVLQWNHQTSEARVIIADKT